ncbi:RagB/SusD family nutrient uptake outer membrane protein [Flammeovirga agarivorans]|uniref:RagB/SusD family nutrient uptake outer membrane protein n=1 Tax=Flammeovirga agarivorans TaxID=2726742 RepID=A0A7X8SKA1_9BACT|nr:RagB/SusD family nutrient uptake outer membrane protein [Flammeovirga agarivorans]NLR91692.1 RagB/SusD family nutrient uptake outer membrane protein [Flammeovirga agarivorans]
MNYTKYIFLAFIVSLFYSCDIHRDPYNSIDADDLLGTEAGLQTATNGNYANLKGKKDESAWFDDWHRITEYPTDNVSLSGTTTDPLFYFYNFRNIPNNSRSSRFWSYSYRTIVGCNQIIEKAEKAVSPSMDHLIGENYYLRGMLMFYLVNVYGRPYTQGPDNLGVPIKLSTDVTDLPPRAKVGEVYEQILEDLKMAEELMTLNKSNVYASKEAAQALLSRVYLYMDDLDNSIEYSNKVINSGKYSLLSTEQLRRSMELPPEGNPEEIFSLKFTKDADYGHGWYTVGGMYATIQNVGWGEMYASKSFVDLINQNPEDARKSHFEAQYLKDEAGAQIPSVFWVNENNQYVQETLIDDSYIVLNEKEYTIHTEEMEGETLHYFIDDMSNKQYVEKDHLMEDRNGYFKYFIYKCSMQEGEPHLWSPTVSRLGEIYLNLAEAYAKKGDVSNALANVNIIRQRAGIPTVSNIGDKELIDVVLDERRLELVWEGHRKFDVFRNNKTMDRLYPGTHLSGTDAYEVIPPTHNRVIEFIPEDQILVQPNLVQNP